MKHEAIKIFTAQDSIQAEMIISTLKSSSIPSYKKDLGNGGIMGIYGGNSKDGADIYVADTDAEAAAEILEGMGLINS